MVSREFQKAVEIIAGWSNVSTYGLQDEDIAFFIRTVAEFSRLSERGKIDYMWPLRRYFDNRKDVIRDYLIKTYGKQARLMGNQIHMALYGKPWPFEPEQRMEGKEPSGTEKVKIIAEGRAEIYSIVTAIKGYVPENKSRVEALLQLVRKKTKSLHPRAVARELFNDIISRVQLELEKINDQRVLAIILEQRGLIEKALADVWRQEINLLARALKFPQIDIRNYELFVEPLFERIVEEIKARQKRVA